MLAYSLDSFCVRALFQQLDVLCNNAGGNGTSISPHRGRLRDASSGTNRLGHFALTGLLIDLLIGTPDSRVISASSRAHHIGWIRKWLAYSQSKLANLLRAFEKRITHRLNHVPPFIRGPITIQSPLETHPLYLDLRQKPIDAGGVAVRVLDR
jgi:hypothetical protein